MAHRVRRGDTVRRYMFFFDESENSHTISFHSDGTMNITDESVGDAFIGVFCGMLENEINAFCERFSRVESEIREIYNLPDSVELKSELFKRKQFKFGASSFDRNARRAMSLLFHELRDSGAMIVITYVSKMEAMVRQMFAGMELPEYAVDDLFYANMTRFFRYYFSQDDLREIYCRGMRDPEDLRAHLISLFSHIIDSRREDNDMDMAAIVCAQNMNVLRGCRFEPDVRPKYAFPYEKSFQWFTSHLRSRGIRPSKTRLIIDGIDGQYPEESLGILRAEYVDSKEEIVIRVCDMVAGFVSKMTWSLYRDMFAWKPGDEFMNATEDELQQLDERWFDLDEETFALYKDVDDVINKNGTDTVMSWAYADPPIAMHTLVSYIASFDEFENYRQIDLDWHKRMFNDIGVDILSERGDRITNSYCETRHPKGFPLDEYEMLYRRLFDRPDDDKQV